MITDWLTAIGTIAVAIIAVFQDQIRSWLNRPRLEVSISVAPPDCHKTTLVQTLNMRDHPATLHTDCYYFRIRVRNAGNQRAEYVEVFASELFKQQADESFKRVDSFLPMNLLWSHIREPFIPAISPEMEKLCDLGHIVDPAKRERFVSDHNPNLNVANDKTTMSLDVEVPSFAMGHVIAPGKYRLHLLIGAANSKPVKKTLEISLTGVWHSDEHTMLGEGIGIRII